MTRVVGARVAALAGALVVLGALAGCAEPGFEREPELGTDPGPILEGFGEQLRTDVDGRVATVPHRTDPDLGQDYDTTCGWLPGDQEWPRQWVYTSQVFVEGGDASVHVRAVTDALQTDGWSLREISSGDETLAYGAWREGFYLRVAGSVGDDGFVINGASPCVDEQGRVRRRGPEPEPTGAVVPVPPADG